MFLKSRATRVVFVCFILAGFVEGWFYLKYENEYGKLGVSKSILAEGRYQRSPYAVLEHIPNTVNLKAHYRQNNYGFRNEEDLIVPKPSDEFRVFLFGASAALGQGAMGEFVKISGQDEYETKYTLAARLEELLANVIPGKRVKVFDAAVSG